MLVVDLLLLCFGCESILMVRINGRFSVAGVYNHFASTISCFMSTIHSCSGFFFCTSNVLTKSLYFFTRYCLGDPGSSVVELLR